MKRTDLGLAAIERVFRDMAIDEEWSVREARGFTWWGAWLRQRLWADKAVRSDGETLWQVRAQTAAYRDQPDEPATYALVNAMNADPATSAYVYDPEDATVSARCGAFVYAAVSPWLERFLVMSVALQASIAWLAVPGRAEGRRPRRPAAPDLGAASRSRRHAQPRLHVRGGVLAVHARDPAPGGGDPAAGGPGGLVRRRRELPLACSSRSPASPRRLWALSTIEHPGLGEGALARLFLPRRTGRLPRRMARQRAEPRRGLRLARRASPACPRGLDGGRGAPRPLGLLPGRPLRRARWGGGAHGDPQPARLGRGARPLRDRAPALARGGGPLAVPRRRGSRARGRRRGTGRDADHGGRRGSVIRAWRLARGHLVGPRGPRAPAPARVRRAAPHGPATSWSTARIPRPSTRSTTRSQPPTMATTSVSGPATTARRSWSTGRS